MIEKLADFLLGLEQVLRIHVLSTVSGEGGVVQALEWVGARRSVG